MISSAARPNPLHRRPLKTIEQGNVPKCAKLKSIVVERDEEEIIILPNPTAESLLLTSLSPRFLEKVVEKVDTVAVKEYCEPSSCAAHPLEEYRHFYDKLQFRKRLDKQRESVARRYEQGWSLLLHHFATYQQPHLSKASTKQAFQRALKQKKNNLESVLVNLKHELAADFTRSPLPYPLPNVGSYTNQCITLEFFGNVIAPFMPGVFSVFFQAYFCGVDANGKVVEFVDLATSFVCVVNQKGWRSHVYEYWLPDVSNLSCKELYLVLEGEHVEQVTSKLGNLADSARGKLEALKILEKEVDAKLKDGRGRPRKRKEAARNALESSPSNAMVNTPSSKKARLSHIQINGTTPSKPLLSKTPYTPSAKETNKGREKLRSKFVEVVPLQTSKGGWKRMRGAKLIGKWVRNEANKTVEKFVPIYGRTGVKIVNETEDRQTSPSKRKQQKYAPIFETIEHLQQLTKPLSTIITTCSTLQIEISNENGYGGNSKTQKKKRKRRPACKSDFNQSLQPAIAYQFLEPWPVCKTEGNASGDCSTVSDCSSSDTSSGYASMSTASSKSSVKCLENLANSMAVLPEDAKPDLTMKCVICDGVFDTLQRLMLHLHTSYPSFCFEFGRSKENVIDVCLAGKVEGEVLAKQIGVNRRKCVLDKNKIKENILLNKKSIEDWRQKILLKKVPSKTKPSSNKYSSTSTQSSSTTKTSNNNCDSNTSRKPEFEDLFLSNLPFVGPIYTKLSDPPLPNLFGVDTNQGWLKELSQWRLQQFTDVTENEKKFFVLWNSFVIQRPNRAIGCRRLFTLLQNFVELKGQELIERKFLFNFLSHCAALQKQGFISQHEMFDAILLLQKLDIPPQQFYTSPFKQQQVYGFNFIFYIKLFKVHYRRRSPRKKSSPKKFSQEIGE